MKNRLRKSLLEKRLKEFPERDIEQGQIEELLFPLPEMITAQTVFCYVDYRGEVKTRNIIKQLLKEGKTVCVPYLKSSKPPMKAKKINSLDELTEGVYGIETAPTEAQEVSPEEIDVVIVPGAAFDTQGNRLGYGGGFYDEFLSRLNRNKTKCIAPLFSFQLVKKVPTDDRDEPVDILVTPSRVHRDFNV